MNTFQLDCAKCKKQISLALQESSIQAHCPNCNTQIWTEVFPALFTGTAPGQAGENIAIDTESSCFYHPSKKAAVACQSCGRFLCSLCDVEFNGQHLCSACIEKGATRGKLERLQNERVRYDDIALILAVLPVVLIIFFWISFITAAAAIFITVRYWNAPRSVIYPSKWRFVVAITVASLELAVWGYFGVRLMSGLF
jgi:hypothetical protein